MELQVRGWSDGSGGASKIQLLAERASAVEYPARRFRRALLPTEVTTQSDGAKEDGVAALPQDDGCGTAPHREN